MKATGERPPRVDMSPEAIDRRLRELGQLYRLGMSLQKARRIGKVGEPPRTAEAPPKESP
ncbi:MAG TPA: hypothetical protein VEW48_03740 [Thermoanaerobaculia bacterium]|nr:hypothetical protein [Thermoanaerobaculia bacterium]